MKGRITAPATGPVISPASGQSGSPPTGPSMADEAQSAARSGDAGAAPAAQPAGGGLMDGLKDMVFGSTGPRGGRHAGLAQTAATSAMRSIGSAVGRELIRGVLGSLLGGGRRR